jgi:hypothetical protein
MFRRLRCWLVGHAPTERARNAAGVRVFRCPDCGDEMPQVSRTGDEAKLMQTTPAHEALKARKAADVIEFPKRSA